MKMYLDLDEELIESAEELARSMTYVSDCKALNDIAEIERYLMTHQGSVNEYLLDHQIRCEYPIIAKIDMLDSQHACEVTPGMHVQTTAENVMRSRLRVDRRAILVNVLLRHGRIQSPDEVYM